MSAGEEQSNTNNEATEKQSDSTSVEGSDSLAELHKQLEESKNKYLYLYADFENFKKRAIKERSEFLKFGHEGLIRELLQVVDNLTRALDSQSQDQKTNEALMSGLQMVKQQFLEVLAKFGVSPIQTVGEKFDPTVHEAVEQEATSDEKSGSVLREHQKGYLLHGRLLRPARVVVGVKSN
ncbi:MAG: nucleotide exchange factor GrpE [Bacteriovoracia bacterium]